MFDQTAVDMVWFFAGIAIAYFVGREHGNSKGFMEGYECGSAAPTADEDDTECD